MANKVGEVGHGINRSKTIAVNGSGRGRPKSGTPVPGNNVKWSVVVHDVLTQKPWYISFKQ